MTGGGGLIIDRNDNDGGVGSDFDDKLHEEDDRTQRAIYHGMGVTYDFFLSCIADEAMGLIN